MSIPSELIAESITYLDPEEALELSTISKSVRESPSFWKDLYKSRFPLRAPYLSVDTKDWKEAFFSEIQRRKDFRVLLFDRDTLFSVTELAMELLYEYYPVLKSRMIINNYDIIDLEYIEEIFAELDTNKYVQSEIKKISPTTYDRARNLFMTFAEMMTLRRAQPIDIYDINSSLKFLAKSDSSYWLSPTLRITHSINIDAYWLSYSMFKNMGYLVKRISFDGNSYKDILNGMFTYLYKEEYEYD